ncbi:hypothetical protein I5U23_06015 [Stenotrophomonas maltophilia]|uniref:Uncharacterized protein n=1 Tax=Stenotrophomonas pavanii TaxID=487698 RepID=A0A246KZN6_9GAMM|nr:MULTISPECIES: hypothetical protein [Stenotrophomonas]MBH1617477.1 hypothetical protein [Stenotrophomonas maltophilia]OWR33869.1 hypothetical protein CEE55_09570 [Stenotrophomonas pavanii]WNV14445.1 hypothetical protein RS400_20195 [Stenotrophomonas maltophilia]HEL4770302.1 hypothetical protein [Stenotrophomonas maltophilia]HEL5614540.1 hypothetical protein [Stenotrophomonas maltophilia]
MNVSALNVAVANDDATTHDLFSAVRLLQRIHTMPMAALSQLIAALERRPGALEALSVGQLLAMVRDAEVAA